MNSHMNTQIIMKVLALISLALTGVAIALWRKTGEAPSPWLIRAALAAFGLAFVVFVIDKETRPRIMLQFLAALFAAIALFAFVADISVARSGAGFHATSILQRMHDFTPSLLMSVRGFTTRAFGAWAYDPFLTTILSLPAALVFALAAMISGFAGRPRREVRIFVN